MDIDDIIEDFEDSASSKKLSKTNLYSEMVQAMVNERMSPEVLPFQHNLLNTLLELLASQQQYLLDSHEYGHMNASTGVVDNDFKLQLMIMETDIERVNYLIRLYLRTRLSKLDNFTIFYINQMAESEGTDAAKILSVQEKQYIQRHLKILTKLYNNCFLAKLPPTLTLLDDESGGLSMVVEPDLDQPVFVQYSAKEPLTVRLADDEVEFEHGGIYIVRYSAIREYLRIGDVRLI